MEDNLKKNEKHQIGISDLDQFLLSSGDDAISIMSFVEDARDEGERTGRNFEALQENQVGSCKKPSSA